MEKQSAPKESVSEINSMIDKKFALMAQLQKLKSDMRQLDREMLKVGGTRADVNTVVLCW